MEKELKRLIRILKAEYALMWVLTVLLAALYECDILPQGLFAGDAQMEYIMQVTSILLTICLIPPVAAPLQPVTYTAHRCPSSQECPKELPPVERNTHRPAHSSLSCKSVCLLLDDGHHRIALHRYDRNSLTVLRSRQRTPAE